jgi:hypothetical protein
MVHVPAATSVTAPPDTVQTDVVCEVKVTGRPDDVLPVIVNGAVPNTWFERGQKMMLWPPSVTWNPWFTGVAAAQFALPACAAWRVQAPADTSESVDPDTVHTAGVVEEKLTARPDDALALSENDTLPNA